jgi:hypothetical protein
MRGWVSVRWKLPDDDEYVLCYTSKFGKIGYGYGGYEILFYNTDTKKWESYEKNDFENNPDYVYVTHWRKLPDEPISVSKNIKNIKNKWKQIIKNYVKDMFG